MTKNYVIDYPEIIEVEIDAVKSTQSSILIIGGNFKKGRLKISMNNRVFQYFEDAKAFLQTAFIEELKEKAEQLSAFNQHYKTIEGSRKVRVEYND